MTCAPSLTTASRYGRIFGVSFAIAFAPLQGVAQTPGKGASASARKADAKASSDSAEAGKSSVTLDQCLSAHRDSQQFRNRGKLIESQQLLQSCADDACPAPVRRDCARWVGEVAAQIPSVVFRLESKGTDSTPIVRVFVNDDLTYSVLPIRPVQFNPGRYKLRFATEGKQEVEQDLVLEEGEKAKEVSVNFDAAQKRPEPPPIVSTPAAAPPAKPVVVSPKPTPVVESRPVPIATYIFAGLGVAATVSFAAWGISSKSLVSDLDGRCSPNCPEGEVDSARQRAAIADISLGVGVASFATATILYFLRPTVTNPVQVDVGMLPRGGWAASVQVHNF